MKLHLVFEFTLASELADLLNKHGFETETDITLEQFRDFVSAHPLPAEVALIDGVAGIIDKRDSVNLLKQIRANAPNMRLIVVLPASADPEWIRSLGRLGIYDIHATGEFTIGDVLTWIDQRGTIADVLDDDVGVKGRIEAASTPKLGSSRSKERVKEIVVKEVVMQERVVERIVGSVAIGIAGSDRRTGATHAALSMAAWLAQQQFSVAYVECGLAAIYILDSEVPSKITQGGFSIGGFDCFPAHQQPEQWISLMEAGYDYVILDLGKIEKKEHMLEFVRCPIRFLTLGAAEWDIDQFFQTLDKWLGTYPQHAWNAIVNFADLERFNEITQSLSKREREVLNLQFVHMPLHSNFLYPPNYSEWLETILPKVQQQRERWWARWLHKFKFKRAEAHS